MWQNFAAAGKARFFLYFSPSLWFNGSQIFVSTRSAHTKCVTLRILWVIKRLAGCDTFNNFKKEAPRGAAALRASDNLWRWIGGDNNCDFLWAERQQEYNKRSAAAAHTVALYSFASSEQRVEKGVCAASLIGLLRSERVARPLSFIAKPLTPPTQIKIYTQSARSNEAPRWHSHTLGQLGNQMKRRENKTPESEWVCNCGLNSRLLLNHGRCVYEWREICMSLWDLIRIIASERACAFWRRRAANCIKTRLISFTAQGLRCVYHSSSPLVTQLATRCAHSSRSQHERTRPIVRICCPLLYPAKRFSSTVATIYLPSLVIPELKFPVGAEIFYQGFGRLGFYGVQTYAKTRWKRSRGIYIYTKSR